MDGIQSGEKREEGSLFITPKDHDMIIAPGCSKDMCGESGINEENAMKLKDPIYVEEVIFKYITQRKGNLIIL